MLVPVRTLADVGCDHGRFGAAALRRGLCGSVIASDISAPSLEKARRLADELDIRDRFDLRVSNGFSAYAPGETQAAALLGMGGELIASILDAAPDIVRELECIVMQPMRGEAELRAYLYKNGFMIDDESIALDGGRYYQLIRAHKSPESASVLPDFWPRDWYQFGPEALIKGEELMPAMMARYHRIMRSKLDAAKRKGAVPEALVTEIKNTETLLRLFDERFGHAE